MNKFVSVIWLLNFAAALVLSPLLFGIIAQQFIYCFRQLHPFLYVVFLLHFSTL